MSKSTTFPYLQAVYFAISKFIDNFRTFLLFTLSYIDIVIVGAICAALLAYLLSYAIGIPADFEQLQSLSWMTLHQVSSPTLLYFIAINCAFLPIFALYLYQLVRLSFSIYQGSPLSLRELFSIRFKELFQFTGAGLLYILMVYIGFIFLVIPGLQFLLKHTGTIPFYLPGLYFGAKYFFPGFSIIDTTTTSIKDDMELRATLTKPFMWQLLFVLILHLSLPRLLDPAHAIIRQGVFWIFLLPILVLIEVHLYHSLKSQMSSS